MNGAHNFFCLYAPVICEQPQLRGMSRTLTLCLQFPIVTTILCGQLAGKPWQFSPQSVIILHSNVCLGLSNPYISSALWRQRKSKNTAHYIPSCSEAWMKQWMQITGALFIAYDALRMNILFSATLKTYWPQTQNMTSADILFNLFPSTFPPHH